MRVRQVRQNTHLGYGALPGPHYEARVIDMPDGTPPADCKIVAADTPLSGWGQYRPIDAPATPQSAPPAPVIHDAPAAPPAPAEVPAPEPEPAH